MTNLSLNECQSVEVTLSQQWNVSIVCVQVQHDRELCLSPICSVPSCRGLTYRWSRYRFPRSIFSSNTLSLLSVLLLFFFNFTIFIFPSHILRLHISLYVSLRLGTYNYSVYRNEERGVGWGGMGGVSDFQIPSTSISQDS